MRETALSRRAVLSGVIAAGTALLVPGHLRGPAELETVAPPNTTMAITGSETRLALRCVHTGHRCDARFMRGSAFDAEGLAELNEAMRDWRTGDSTDMDPALLVALAGLRDSLDLPANRPFDLISGYRSPHTNAALGQRSNGVASKSQHVLGKAADIALPGIETGHIRSAALELAAGGVGHYPRDGFVHIDTGRVRFW